MGRKNVQVFYDLMNALNKGPAGVPAGLALCAPDLEIQDLVGMPDSEWHQGYEGAIRWGSKIFSSFSDFTVSVVEAVEAPGGEVVATVMVEVVGKRSGVPATLTSYSVFSFQDGKVRRTESYATRAEALEAVGLAE